MRLTRWATTANINHVNIVPQLVQKYERLLTAGVWCNVLVHYSVLSAISDDLAFHDRWAAYLPGWELPKLTPELLTTHVGFILDYTSELFHRELRRLAHYSALWEQWFQATPSQWSARDVRSANRTFSGLTKLIFPSGIMTREDARMLLRLALELRLRVRLQLHAISPQEFPLAAFTYTDRTTGALEEVHLAA